ncbi:hypothetical protein DEQ92_18105 [Haloferax sp. Atlit-6N]|uniref:hypothetical protein n=1 Tax=Haloferax sp. Atlit-6N TaxID=2077205 RepID=UPI000E2899F3|nr:hypothetical protein [Haloferax sp. Atlit-6N]REA01263.1 hypothetical protein DEQ92_18105 [Haloferax sp. Atlit-6N]
MTGYTHEDHRYDCEIPSNEIQRALVELDKPWKSKQVLKYFHEQLKYSTRQIADLFGVTRQTLQNVVYEFDDFHFSMRHGRMTKMDMEQRTLDDYENETSGLSDFV